MYIYNSDKSAVIRLSDNTIIPIDDDNPLYKKFLNYKNGWTEQKIDIATGEVVEVISHPPHAIEQVAETEVSKIIAVSRAAFKLALKQAGILLTVENAIAQLPRYDDARILYEDSTNFNSNNQVLLAMSKKMGISQQQFDAVFELAKNMK